jgi:hypothetical protein
MLPASSLADPAETIDVVGPEEEEVIAALL